MSQLPFNNVSSRPGQKTESQSGFERRRETNMVLCVGGGVSFSRQHANIICSISNLAEECRQSLVLEFSKSANVEQMF